MCRPTTASDAFVGTEIQDRRRASSSSTQRHPDRATHMGCGASTPKPVSEARALTVETLPAQIPSIPHALLHPGKEDQAQLRKTPGQHAATSVAPHLRTSTLSETSSRESSFGGNTPTTKTSPYRTRSFSMNPEKGDGGDIFVLTTAANGSMKRKARTGRAQSVALEYSPVKRLTNYISSESAAQHGRRHMKGLGMGMTVSPQSSAELRSQLRNLQNSTKLSGDVSAAFQLSCQSHGCVYRFLS